MPKFLHAADIHLDSPLLGLERYDGAPVDRLRDATRGAFQRLVTLAIEEPVDFVLVAGDLWDRDWRDYGTGLFFVEQASRLHEAGIRLLLVLGNHDAASRLTRSLRWPPNVTRFGTRVAHTVEIERAGVAVHGRSFSEAQTSEDLAAGYPDPIPGAFNIGLLHTSLDGRPGHDRYAPCRLGCLVDKGYDYWALGHVHRREVVCERPWVVFPGNLQGRHAREVGAKGCTLVTVEERRARVVHRDLDVLRWEACAVDASPAATLDGVIERFEEALEALAARNPGLPLAIRVEIRGASPAHAALAADPERLVSEVRGAAIRRGGDAWVEKVRLSTTPPAMDAGGEPEGPLAGVAGALARDPARLAAFAAAELADLKARLPRAAFQGDDALDLAGAAALERALARARELLAARLGRAGDA